MKKRFLLFAACLSVLTTFAQVENEDGRWMNIDLKEDSTEIVTIEDIIREQQDVTSRNTREMHFADVWGRRGFFNIAYNKDVSLIPWHPIKEVYSDPFTGAKADWSFTLQKGRNYPLHKKPIGNTVQICLDYTGLDLTANHYKPAPGQFLYDSSQKTQQTVDGKIKSYYYVPWKMEKYEASYGMSLGPSITIAPFNYVNYDPIHYLKFNVYYHVGYQASILYMLNNKEADANTAVSADHSNMSENLKLLWGHGMYTTFGANMSWKAIGIGFEKRSGSTRYQPLNTSDFGTGSNGFNSNFTRFYFQIRM